MWDGRTRHLFLETSPPALFGSACWKHAAAASSGDLFEALPAAHAVLQVKQAGSCDNKRPPCDDDKANTPWITVAAGTTLQSCELNKRNEESWPCTWHKTQTDEPLTPLQSFVDGVLTLTARISLCFKETGPPVKAFFWVYFLPNEMLEWSTSNTHTRKHFSFRCEHF